MDKKLYDLEPAADTNSLQNTEPVMPDKFPQESDRNYNFKTDKSEKPEALITDIKKGNRNNQIVSSSKVQKTDMLQPSIQTENYLNGANRHDIQPLTHKSDEMAGQIPECNEKVKIIKLGPLRFKKNRITKSLNKLQMQANLRNSDTQSLLAISVYNP